MANLRERHNVVRSKELKWLAEVVSSSDVVIYELRIPGWILYDGAKRCMAISEELILAYSTLLGSQI